jgi:hypothetical protein
MKKFRLLITSLFLAMALLLVNISPVKVYANDIGDDPQGTSQKKAAPPQIPLDLIIFYISLIRLR